MNRLIISIMLFGVCAPLQAQLSLPENEHACFIVPTRVADVGSPVRGVVQRLLVDRGDTVVEGQPIAELYAGNERILVTHAKARAEMRSELAARKADLKLATLELTRVEDMHKQELAPTQQRDEARLRKQVAEAGLAQAGENQQLAEIELDRANYNLAQRTLRSPMNGVVVEQRIFPGEFIYDAPIMSIATLDPLRVEVVLPSDLFGSVQVGNETVIFPELDRNNPINAMVDAVDALLDTRSATFGVRLKLPNKELTITAGQKCTVDFSSGVSVVTLVKESN